jgi:exodeoxyribonuclease V alpha subunit
MLDLPTTYRVLRAMETADCGARLLLLGDPGQLPPIGYGKTFHHLVECDWMSKATLVEVHRQAASTGIPAAAQLVRDGVMPKFREWISHRAPGVFLVPATERSMSRVVADVVADLGGFREARVVGSRRAGPDGVDTLNALFHARLASPGPAFRFRVDEPVMWVANDYDRDLFNGTMGYVTAAGADGRFSVDFEGRVLEFGLDDLDSIELAYAATAHKLQGSSFPRVVVPVLPNRNMDRTLIYTAITRAQVQVVLVGDPQHIAQIVEAPPRPSIREIGLGRIAS